MTMQSANPVWPTDHPRIGLGCMALTGIYGRVDPHTAIASIRRALDLGIDHFDTAELYGPYLNEELLANALGADTRRVTIATKFGYKIEEGQIAGLNSHPSNIRFVVEGSLRRLKRDYIDLLYQHRPDPAVPVEEVIGAMSDLVGVGKVRWLGLSATDADTLRRAETVHPIAAVQNEYSCLKSSNSDELLEAVELSGAVFIAHSPLGRGRLAAAAHPKEARSSDDYRGKDDRFTLAALDAIQPTIAPLCEIARERDVTPASVALAWLLACHPTLRAIPGAKSPAQINDSFSALSLQLTPVELAKITAA